MITYSDISLIIPCFNEALRLKKTHESLEKYYRHGNGKPGIIFVDDGSTDDTAEKLEQMCQALGKASPQTSFRVVSYPQNRGKGWAIYQGILDCRTPWCLTLDADLSSGPEELDFWMENKWLDLSQEQVYIASRELGIRAGLVKFNPFRRMAGLIFNRLVRMLTGLPFEDTQCGFKIYPTATAKTAFSGLSDYGFAHDVEVLLKLRNKGIRIQALPAHWKPEDGSKVNMIADSWRMLRVVWKLRTR